MKKSKKTTDILVLVPERPAPDTEAMLNQLVQRKVQQALANEMSTVFEPFFRDQRVAIEIRKLQDVLWQNKFSFYFEDHGCMICHDRSVPHASLGMCIKCLGREKKRISDSVRRRQPDAKPLEKYKALRIKAALLVQRGDEAHMLDLQSLAQEALAPSIEVLSKKRGRPSTKAWILKPK